MKINISSIHFKADQKLEGFIQEKLNKLSTIYEGVLGSEVTLKIDKDEKICIILKNSINTVFKPFVFLCRLPGI